MTASELEGAGEVYSWATVRIPLSPEFEDEVPYTVVVVNMREGVRLMGRLLDISAEPEAGAEVTFEPYRANEIVLPGFRLVASSDV